MQSNIAESFDKRTDAEIIKRILCGRVNDFEILINRYSGYVFKIVSGRLPPDVVPELSHDIFVEAYRSLPKYDERKIFKKWLAGIAFHRCYDYWRMHYKNREIPISALNENHKSLIDEYIAAESEDAFGSIETQKEAREILEWALADLSAKDRMVLTLVYFEELSLKEAAKILGWTLVNVKVRMHRSQKKLRKKITYMLAGDA